MGRLDERLGSLFRNLSRDGSKASETSQQTSAEESDERALLNKGSNKDGSQARIAFL